MGWTNLKLNKKYADWIMNTADAEINISEGSVRSGKTTAMILAFCMYLETMTYEGLHVAAAENLANAWEILAEGGGGLGIIGFFGEDSVRSHVYKGRTALTITLNGMEQTVVFVGGGKSNSFRSLRGLTIEGVIGTEMDLMHESFIDELMARTLASKSRKLFFDLNPTLATGWIYTDYIDRWAMDAASGRLLTGFNHIRVVMPDNPIFTEEDIERIKSQYDPESNAFKALILGERINTGGTIYMVRDYNQITELPPIIEWIVTVDVGISSSATTFLAAGITAQYKIILFDYKYHKNGKELNDYKSYDDYAVDLAAFVRENAAKMGKSPRRVFIDRDITFMRSLLRVFPQQNLNRNLIDYVIKDKINTRIEATRNSLYNNKLQIMTGSDYPQMKDVVIALQNVVYDMTEFNKGKLVRLDNTLLDWNPVDTVDPVEYAHSYFAAKYNI